METTQTTFKGQNFYIGIDVHARQWHVTIRTEQLFLRTFSMNPSPKELLLHLRRHYPGGNYFSVYEAGFCGFWIHRELTRLGLDNMVVHPADVPTTHKEKDRKSDKIDSKKLARELAKNNLIGIYIPSEFHEQLRSLVRLRYKTVQDCTRLKNRIKAYLRINGIEIPAHTEVSHWSGRFIKWLQNLELSHQPGRDYLDQCIEKLQEERKRLLKNIRLLRQYAKEIENSTIVSCLDSLPGFGFITAITFYAELIDILRFHKFDHLASYVGLVPSTSSSDEKKTIRGLTNRRNRYLRHLIIEAAWIAVRQDPVLLAKFNELTRRMKKQEAIVRIAKKLLSRLYHVWQTREPYVIGAD